MVEAEPGETQGLDAPSQLPTWRQEPSPAPSTAAPRVCSGAAGAQLRHCNAACGRPQLCLHCCANRPANPPQPHLCERDPLWSRHCQCCAPGAHPGVCTAHSTLTHHTRTKPRTPSLPGNGFLPLTSGDPACVLPLCRHNSCPQSCHSFILGQFPVSG